MSSAARTTVLMLAFDEMELLDFAGPYEVFTTASRVHARRHGGAQAPRFQVLTASCDGHSVRARAGLPIGVEHALADAPDTDWLLVPGGVVDGVLAQADTLNELARRAPRGELSASVCTGAFVLAAAGIVTDGEVTTHWEDADELAQRFPRLHVRTDRRWVDRGRTVTSAGIAAGIDMALHLVGRAAGTELAQATARQMDYPWTPAP